MLWADSTAITLCESMLILHTLYLLCDMVQAKILKQWWVGWLCLPMKVLSLMLNCDRNWHHNTSVLKPPSSSQCCRTLVKLASFFSGNSLCSFALVCNEKQGNRWLNCQCCSFWMWSVLWYARIIVKLFYSCFAMCTLYDYVFILFILNCVGV